MAMPSEFPPPLPIEYRPLVEAALALAERMAASVKCGVGDVFRRVKSRNWMVGKLSREWPGFTAQDIHDVLDELRQRHRPTSPDELAQRRVTLTNRRPQKFHEANTWPAWAPRVDVLGSLVAYPMTSKEIATRARLLLGWRDLNWVKQTVAAAEDANELWYDRAFGLWARFPERIVMVDKAKKVQVKRVQRRLPVALGPEEQTALTGKIRDIDAEVEGIEGEIRALRAKIRERDEARERVIEAMKSGREVRQVDCEERWDYAAKRVTTVRKDTGAEVDGRDMTPDELQVTMPEAATS